MNPHEIVDARIASEKLNRRTNEASDDRAQLVERLLSTIEDKNTEIATLEARIAELEEEAAP